MKEIMDGNKACAYASYNFSELASIYPITPSSTMAETVDELSNSGKLNFFNQKVKVVEMQSEAGAIATVHGALQNGVLATTYTSSQGLLLMIPNMYKIAGELLPCVINVAARTIATHALSIMGDHSDIYAVRPTGFAILSSSSVQQAMDLTNVAYLSTIKGRIPFVNFFDGFRTSHEYRKIDVIDYEKVKKLIDEESLNKFRNSSLDIDNPTTRGTNQSDQIYFQVAESRNKYYDKLPDIVNGYMEAINKITNEDYKPFNYYGNKNATKVIIAMGSVCNTIKETIDALNSDIGLIEVHLYRPFSSKYLLNVLPKTTKKIAVLDRTKEPGANGEPLYLDVCEIIHKNNLDIKVVGGRYGLSSKDTTPEDIYAVYDYLENDNLHTFTIGIEDDVTNLSLKKKELKIKTTALEMLIWGYGSDGMVTASKDILTIIGHNKEKEVQGYFEYDSKKSGGITKCHLRFSNEKIRSSYYVKNPSIVVCSKDTYLKKYDVLNGIKENGIFLLNTEHEVENLKEIIPNEVINTLKEKNIKFYIVNANLLANKNNIPNKISMIMESTILKISNILDKEEIKDNIKTMITKNFSKKGKDIVRDNINALEESFDIIKEVNIDNLVSNINLEIPDNNVFSLLEHAKGNNIPVSMAKDIANGTVSAGLSKLEKRGISNITPCFDKDKCIMCNLCSFVCPHSVIRPYLLTEEEANNAKEEVKEDLKDAKIKDSNLKYTIGISPLDCTGCNLCAGVCPTKAITMENIEKTKHKEMIKHEYLESLNEKIIMPKTTVKASQFSKPKFEFHGACAGCGETPYLKLLTQLFGDNLMIANATGCSSIYGASIPNTPYSVPWANSLFEDNAEFGYGIRISENIMRDKVRKIMKEKQDLNEKNKELVDKYLNQYNYETSKYVYDNLDYDNIKELIPYKKYIKEKSIWSVGGDGWAYDIGFGGIDHILSTKENINILVLDTEVYSNTGGQASKSTRVGAKAKFAASGKETAKKDLASIALTYPHVYVATISLGANYQQTINALIEANNYNGPSIVIAYAPCIAHGIKEGMKDAIKEEKLVVESGYFPLFRYNPITKELKKDSKSYYTKYEEFFIKENRYASLNTSNKEELFRINKENAILRENKLIQEKEEIL